MNEHLDDDDVPLSRKDRELTLSTGAILAIFFALVVVCGACFGVGYNVGRKSIPVPLALNESGLDGATPSVDAGSTSKPSAGSVLETPAPSSPPVVVAAPSEPKPAPIVRKPPVPVPAPTSEDSASSDPVARNGTSSSAPEVRSVPPSALLPGASTSPAPAGSYMVQVAAVSHKEDAELLLGALRARGYTVSARPSAADNFIHVQVGPFSDKKEAETMRQRLLSDGYNAMLKY